MLRRLKHPKSAINSAFASLLRKLLASSALDRIPYKIIRIGSLYGGWWIAVTPSIKGSHVIACGAGEDISFDIGIASMFDAKICIVDPTPRAKSHIRDVLLRLGEESKKPFTNNGEQDPLSYDLSQISSEQIISIDVALWDKDCITKFYCPTKPEEVSHSISNYQDNYKEDGSYIEVKAERLISVLTRLEVTSQPEIVKLDIEGAEHEVIRDMIQSNILPHQLLIEFDELRLGSIRGIQRFRKTRSLLYKHGYRLFCKESYNYCFLRQKP
jgi:FkbM family methyltransferase